MKENENNKIKRIDITKNHKDYEKYGELWNADPDCKHKLIHGSGGGWVCEKCGGWYCY